MSKVIPTMSQADALAAGYTKCLQDGYENVTDIDDLTPEELQEGTYFLSGLESYPFTVSADEIADLVIEHVRNQTEVADDDDKLAEAVANVPDELYEQLSVAVNEKLSVHQFWATLDIQLVP